MGDNKKYKEIEEKPKKYIRNVIEMKNTGKEDSYKG